MLTVTRFLIVAALISLAVPRTLCQTASAPERPMPAWQIAAGGRQQFDVVSVREDRNQDDPSSVNVPYGPEDAYTNTGGVFLAKNWSVATLISFAFRNSTAQRDAFIASLPAWVFTTGYNIEARTENHDVSKDQMRLMVQSLLFDRFNLKVHYETREVPVYAVELLKPGVLGPGLRPHPAGDLCPAVAPPRTASNEEGTPPPQTVAGGFPIRCGSFVNMPAARPYLRREGARNLTVTQIVGTFTGMGNLGRPAIDRTGLAGTYDWVMEFLDERPGHVVPPDAEGVPFEEALRKQVGLKLVSGKAPFDYLLVDHLERPTGN